MRRILIAALILSCLVAVRQAGAADSSASSVLDPLAIYAGTWKIDATYAQTPYSTARAEHSILRTSCWSSPGYYTCSEARLSRPATLVVYSYDARVHGFFAYYIPVVPGRPVRGASISAVGNVWTIFVKTTDRLGKALELRTVNTFSGNDAFDYEQDYSLDGTTWTRMSSGRQTRLHS